MRPAWEVSSVGRHRAGKRHTGTGAETQDFCSLLRYYVFIAIAAKSRPASEPYLRWQSSVPCEPRLGVAMRRAYPHEELTHGHDPARINLQTALVSSAVAILWPEPP